MYVELKFKYLNFFPSNYRDYDTFLDQSSTDFTIYIKVSVASKALLLLSSLLIRFHCHLTAPFNFYP